MAIPATTPTTVPATEARTYDKWWVARLEVVATDPPMVNLRAELRKFRTADDGINVEFSPDPPAIVNMGDLLTLSQSDAELAALLQGIYAKLAAVGITQGVL